MNCAKYTEAIQERLLTDPLILSFEILRERVTVSDGYLRALINFGEHVQVESAEYLQMQDADSIAVATYSYQWMDTNGELIIRWTKTSHYPKLKNFPHHIHDGKSGNVKPEKLLNIVAVLNEIEKSF
jgi:hypothetical protein